MMPGKVKIVVDLSRTGTEPEIITAQCITALLMQWFDGEDGAEIKARTVAPHVLESLQRSHKLGKITEQQLSDAVMGVLVKAAKQRLGFQAVEYVGGQRHDTLRK
jgi:hypothetical protein